MKDIEISKKKLESKRERGLKFSKHIPKPLIKTNITETTNNMSNRSYDGYGDENGGGGEILDDSYMRRNDEYGMSYEKASRLQELESKHNESKRNIDSIKKSLGL